MSTASEAPSFPLWSLVVSDAQLKGRSGFSFCHLRERGSAHSVPQALQVIEVLVAGGSPCVGFSMAEENRQGIRDPESSKLVVFPFLLSRLKSALPDVHVLFMLENVPMDFSPADKAQRAAISQCLGVEPHCLEASSLLPAERERCFWTNLRVEPLTAVAIDAAAVLEPGWRPLWDFPSGTPASDMRFSTFCREFDRGYPRGCSPSTSPFPVCRCAATPVEVWSTRRIYRRASANC